jgi:hypothetical protein
MIGKINTTMSFPETKDIPNELLPKSRPFLDLQSYRRRIKYTQGTLSSSNNRAEIVLPNEDCCSLNGRLRFRVVVTSNGGTNEAPEFMGHSFIDRMRVEIGGTKVIDLDHFNLLQGIINVATDPSEQQGTRAYNSMSSAAQLSVGTRQTLTTFNYDIPLSLLEDSLLSHKRSLLPLFMLPRTSLTIHTASDAACTSAVGAGASYTIDNLELVMTYYTSPTIKSYFSSVPYQLPFTGCDHRFYSLAAGQTTFDLQIPSNYRSLRSLFAVARANDIDTDSTASNANITYDPLGGPNTKWNVSVNSFRVFQEDIDGRDLFFDQLRRVFGNKVLKSEFFKLGTEFTTDKFIMAAQLNSLGGNEQFVSGARTNQHVSSLNVHITTDTPLTDTLRFDVFLLYDRLLTINGGNLQVIQ